MSWQKQPHSSTPLQTFTVIYMHGSVMLQSSYTWPPEFFLGAPAFINEQAK